MMLLPCSLVLLAFLTVEANIREAKDEDFPFQVSIQNMEKRHLCGGAIITPKWVITAYACMSLSPRSVRVCYGSADSNNPLACAKSQRIVLQNDLNLHKSNRFALIELQEPIEFSKTVKAAGLPTAKASLRNTTKLSGWKVELRVDLPPSLYVSDVYNVIPKDCKSPTGAPVELGFDEFCGVDDESMNYLTSPGTMVSKRAVVLGMLTQPPIIATQPCIFIKLFEHEQWIRDTLGSDSQHVNWVDEIPRDSAISQTAISIALIGISAIFLQFAA